MFTKKGDTAVLAKLGAAPAQHREIAQRLHKIIRETAPDLEPIVRWGLPFYTRDGKDVCYIKPAKVNNSFGKSVPEQSQVLSDLREIEPLLRVAAARD